jgi:hypothetical protein
VQAKRDFEPAPYLIRGNPVINRLVPGLRRDNVWIPAFAGMTILLVFSPITTQSQGVQGKVSLSAKSLSISLSERET